MKRILILLGLLALPGVNAEVVKIMLPPEVDFLKPGAGSQMAKAQCLTCHSADYFSMQPPKGLDFWQGEVKKMKDKYGAPIPGDQMDELAAYFAGDYGTGGPAPVAVAASSGPPMDGQALAQRWGCLSCHKVDVKLIGPAYKDVAAKYRDKPEAMDKVTHQITHGGSGQWGVIPMPSFDQLPPAQVSTLAHWVLDQK